MSPTAFFAFPPSFPHQQRILQFSLALFVSCDKILSKTERYDNTMRKTALPTDRLSETARQKLSRFEAWLLRNGKSYQTIRSYLYTARHFLSLYPEVTHDNLMLYKCYLIAQVQAQHRKFEDPRNELFYGISRAS